MFGDLDARVCQHQLSFFFLPVRRNMCGTCYGNVAGWLDVTRRYCIKMAKPILKLFRPSGSHIILVSSDSCADTNSKGNPFSRGLYIHWGGKNGDFRRKLPFILETVRDMLMVSKSYVLYRMVIISSL